MGKPAGRFNRVFRGFKKCVRIVLKDSDGKLDMEVKNITYTWANA